MESADREARSLSGSNRSAFNVSPRAPFDTGAYVPVSLYLFGHSARYFVPILRCFPAGFLRGLRNGHMAARSMFPWSFRGNGDGNSLRSDLAPELYSPGAQS